MDRMIVYQGQNPQETDILNIAKDSYLGVSKIMESLIGQTTAAAGFGCVPTTPGSLSVQVNPGIIYQAQVLDTNAFSTLGTDAHTVLKQGFLLDAAVLACPAPATVGYSINYLIQVQVLESDGGTQVLPYYNSANPNQSFNGPANSGTSQNTRRFDTAHLDVKTGSAAPSGSQTTPSADVGYLPLYVVTVAYGMSAITSGNIVQHPDSVILPNMLTDFATAAQGAKADAALPASSYTALDVLAKIKTVDGPDSGLDAATLDGHDSSYFAAATDVSNTVKGAASGVRVLYAKMVGSTGGVAISGGGAGIGTVTRNGAGDYTVNFTTAFTSAPVVVGIPHLANVSYCRYDTDEVVTTSSASFKFWYGDSSGGYDDCAFSLLIIGA